jgi:hypothetical protein
MSYAFKRETIRFCLGRQAIRVAETEVKLDPQLAGYPDAVLEVQCGGEPVSARRDGAAGMVILGRPLADGEVGEIQLYAEVDVREASRLQGLRRADLVNEAFDWLRGQGHEIDRADRAKTESHIPQPIWQTFMVGFFERAACLASAEAIRGIPKAWLTVDGFANLPERWVLDWTEAVYHLNPHWSQQPAEGDEEKKAG